MSFHDRKDAIHKLESSLDSLSSEHKELVQRRLINLKAELEKEAKFLSEASGITPDTEAGKKRLKRLATYVKRAVKQYNVNAGQNITDLKIPSHATWRKQHINSLIEDLKTIGVDPGLMVEQIKRMQSHHKDGIDELSQPLFEVKNAQGLVDFNLEAEDLANKHNYKVRRGNTPENAEALIDAFHQGGFHSSYDTLVNTEHLFKGLDSKEMALVAHEYRTLTDAILEEYTPSIDASGRFIVKVNENALHTGATGNQLTKIAFKAGATPDIIAETELITTQDDVKRFVDRHKLEVGLDSSETVVQEKLSHFNVPENTPLPEVRRILKDRGGMRTTKRLARNVANNIGNFPAGGALLGAGAMWLVGQDPAAAAIDATPLGELEGGTELANIEAEGNYFVNRSNNEIVGERVPTMPKEEFASQGSQGLAYLNDEPVAVPHGSVAGEANTGDMLRAFKDEVWRVNTERAAEMKSHATGGANDYGFTELVERTAKRGIEWIKGVPRFAITY